MVPEPDPRPAAGPGDGFLERAVDLGIRLGRAWGVLTRERRWAALTALGLFVSLFLPWYQESVVATTRAGAGRAVPVSASVSGWGAFSLVQAAVLLVALGVLILLFYRAEGRMSELPEGWLVTVAGGLACCLVVIGIFDQPGASGAGHYLLSTGVDWGIFAALLVAGGLGYAGNRIRVARHFRVPARAAAEDGPTGAGSSAAGSDPDRSVPVASASPVPPQAPEMRVQRQPPAPVPSGIGAATTAGATAAAQAKRPARSSWRPAERPAWSEPRPVGWLTAPPRHLQEDEPGSEPAPEPRAEPRPEAEPSPQAGRPPADHPTPKGPFSPSPPASDPPADPGEEQLTMPLDERPPHQ